jgi:nucleotide-binding universal stress UspA family protein
MARPILVPHDGTVMSDKALGKAVEFAGALGSEIIIVHIVDSSSFLRARPLVS